MLSLRSRARVPTVHLQPLRHTGPRRRVQVQDGIAESTFALLWLPVVALAALQAKRVLDDRAAEAPPLNQADIAYKVQSYTVWPVADDTESERVTIPVGDVRVGGTETFLFDKVLPAPSEIVCVCMPRPLGVILEEVPGTKQVVVCDVVDGTTAAQRVQLARFDRKHRASAALPGDILRAVTCTTIVYPARTGLQLGLSKLPERHRAVFGADGQPWPKVRAALKAGLVQDGPVTMVLERAVVAKQQPRAQAQRS